MDKHLQYDEPFVFAVKHKEDEERLQSQSGGMFAVLSDVVLKEDGVIYGCVFDNNFEAIHVRTECAEGRDEMRCSKYVQSNMGDCFQNVAKDLENGRKVLFSGTSCQIAGLLRFLELRNISADAGNLYTVDIVCHGVPSPRVWRDYLAWEKSKKKSEIKSVVSRNKRKYGWKSHVTTITWEKGAPVNSRVFPKIFYGHAILRPSCYHCPYKDVMHPADITIADYWGVDKAVPGFKDTKGVSLALINTDTGNELFSKCLSNIVCEKTRIEDSMQQPLIAPYDSPVFREQFWRDYQVHDFDFIARKYGEYTRIKVMKWKFRYWIRNTFGI